MTNLPCSQSATWQTTTYSCLLKNVAWRVMVFTSHWYAKYVYGMTIAAKWNRSLHWHADGVVHRNVWRKWFVTSDFSSWKRQTEIHFSALRYWNRSWNLWKENGLSVRKKVGKAEENLKKKWSKQERIVLRSNWLKMNWKRYFSEIITDEKANWKANAKPSEKPNVKAPLSSIV